MLKNQENMLPNMNIYITDGSTQTMLPLEPFANVDVNNTNGGEN